MSLFFVEELKHLIECPSPLTFFRNSSYQPFHDFSAPLSPPLTPGKQVTLELRPLSNPSPGTYLFEVKGYPADETARGQYMGLGRLDFYPKSRW